MSKREEWSRQGNPWAAGRGNVGPNVSLSLDSARHLSLLQETLEPPPGNTRAGFCSQYQRKLRDSTATSLQSAPFLTVNTQHKLHCSDFAYYIPSPELEALRNTVMRRSQHKINKKCQCMWTSVLINTWKVCWGNASIRRSGGGGRGHMQALLIPE